MGKIKRVFVIGLTENIGGIESIIMNIYENLDHSKVQYDFIMYRGALNKKYEKIVIDNGGNIYNITRIRENPFKCFKELIKLYKNSPLNEIVHINLSSPTQFIYALPAALVSNKKIISHSHLCVDKNPLYIKILRKIMNKFTDYYLACSILAGECMFGKNVVSTGKVKQINNGICTEKYIYNIRTREIYRKKLGIEEKFVVGNIARFVDQKNHSFLLDIFYEIKKGHENSILLLIGSGELEEEIKAKAKMLSLDDSILFLGERHDIAEFYQALDVFILPSKKEGLPVVGVESQAAGLKCFYSNTITEQVKITELVEFLSLEVSPKVWANQILKYKNGYNRENMYNEILKANYDIRKIAEDLGEFYHNI